MSAAEIGKRQLCEAVEATLQVGLGALALAAGAVKKAVLEARQAVAAAKGSDVIERMREKGQEEQECLRCFMDKTSARLLERLDLARGSELDELRSRMLELEHRLAALSRERRQEGGSTESGAS